MAKKGESWIAFVMKHKKAGMSLGDAMKEASKHKKEWKHGGAADEGGIMEGGMLGPGSGTVAGGRRSRTRKHKGGQLYGFAHGPYTGSPLADGMDRIPPMTDGIQWEGASPAAAQGGGRRHRSRKHSKKATRRHRSRKH